MLCSLSPILLLAQRDSLILLSDIGFHSDFEKKAFNDHFVSGEDNYLALFMAVNGAMNNSMYQENQAKFKSELNTFNKVKLVKKKPEQKIKALYGKIHEAFLKKYDARNEFSSIFKSGSYNCVSSTALYSLVFDEFGIPFNIKETPNHVYLIAYPATERIHVETTDASGGFFQFDEDLKKRYVDHLYAQEIISKREYNSLTIDELIDEYYFTEDEIDIERLIGIQYMNDGIYRFDDGHLVDAFEQFEKAYLFYQHEKIANMLVMLGSYILRDGKYGDLEHVDYLAKLSRFEDYGFDVDVVLAEFGRIAKIHLINGGNSTRYSAFYKRLDQQINNTILKRELEYQYNYDMSWFYFNQGYYDKTLPHIEKAYAVRPENIEISKIMVSTIGEKVRLMSDNQEVINILQSYRDRYKALRENNIFNSMLANAFILEFGHSFDMGFEKKGLEYKALFEGILASLPETLINKHAVGRSYSLMAVYYFKKGHTTKAKQIIDEGLQRAPGSYELMQRKRMLK